MRQVTCTLCHDIVARIDLRASIGGDPNLLEATELGTARTRGLRHIKEEHKAIYTLAEQKRNFDSLIKIGEFIPLDAESRITTTSRMRR